MTGHFVACSLVAALIVACAGAEFTDRELEVTSRNLRVTVHNESLQAVAIWFDSNTLTGQDPIPPLAADTFQFEPQPDPPDRGLPDPEPEGWALIVGQASLSPTGELLGMRGPFITVATSSGPLQPATVHILVHVDEGGRATWRVGEP